MCAPVWKSPAPILRVIGYPSSVICFANATCTLAVPKIFCGIRLEYFDRGAKPCSLLRPQDALYRLCPLGRLFPPFRFSKHLPSRGSLFGT